MNRDFTELTERKPVMDEKKISRIRRFQAWLDDEFGIRPGRKKQPMTKERAAGIVITIIAVSLIVVIASIVLKPVMGMLSDPDQIRTYIEGLGPAGIFAFMGMNILQVFAAVIPGGPFEIAAGYIYGVWKGALICDIAMTLGSLCTFLLGRTLGMRFVRLFVSEENLKDAKILKSSERSNLLTFILFLIPGTPKDILSYLIGLTDMKLPTWILICAVGRFPAILLSTASGIELQQGRYGVFVLMVLATGVISLGGMWFYHKKKKAADRREAARKPGTAESGKQAELKKPEESGSAEE